MRICYCCDKMLLDFNRYVILHKDCYKSLQEELTKLKLHQDDSYTQLN